MNFFFILNFTVNLVLPTYVLYRTGLIIFHINEPKKWENISYIQIPRCGNVLFSGIAVLATVGLLSGCSQAQLDQLNKILPPPEPDLSCAEPYRETECPQYIAGMKRNSDEHAAKDAADMAVIYAYFRRNPTVPLPDPCKPVEGSSSSKPWMVNECRHDVERMGKIDAYFKTHPNAPRPKDCSLPLKHDLLGGCVNEIEEAEAPPQPKPEWHRIIKDTVGWYSNGVYSGGEYVGSREGPTEIHAGKVFLLRPIQITGKDGKVTFVSPLSYKQTSITNGFSSLTLPSDAFDPRVLHCQAKRVLLHEEVTCDD